MPATNMATKTKKFRVAVEGKTIDGREIGRHHIVSMAKNFNLETYAPRVNMEHLRGFSPTGDFNAYGTVIGLETKEIDLKFGDKTEKRLALYADIDANEQLISINKKGQKLFTSVEIYPNFNGNENEFCLGGLAVTDSPASFGTEALKFSASPVQVDGVLNSAAIELEIPTEAESANPTMNGFFGAFTDYLKSIVTPEAAEPKATAPEPNNEIDFSKFATSFTQGIAQMETALAANTAKSESQITELRAEIAELKASIDKTPSPNHTQRPIGSGSAQNLAVC